MLIGLLIAGNLSGFGGAEQPANDAPLGGGGKRLAWDDAQAQWDSRQHWKDEAAKWLADVDALPQAATNTPESSTPQSTGEVSATPVAQDAPRSPRTAKPAPNTLPWLLERTEGRPAGDLLMQAMIAGEQARIAQAAFEAHQWARQDDEALATLLVLMEAA